MTPEQFLDRLKKSPAPVYLFLGQEAYQRERCRRTLIENVLSPEDRESGFIRHDLGEISLAAAIDDARSLSLFATERVIWLASAEAALPRGDAGVETPELAQYIKEPTPGTVVVIEASRYDFEGDDKQKMERVQKFYAAVPAQVEFHHYSPDTARSMAQALAKQAGLNLGLAELAVLLEATAGDVARIAIEIEKLKLFTGDRKVTADDIGSLVPDAQATTIFALVNALGRGDRTGALQILDALSRAGEYMPLALTFLATQFRMALVARSGIALVEPDPGPLQQARRQNLARTGTPDRTDGSSISESKTGAGGGEAFRGGPLPSRCTPRRPHRDGRDDSGINYAELNQAVASLRKRSVSRLL